MRVVVVAAALSYGCMLDARIPRVRHQEAGQRPRAAVGDGASVDGRDALKVLPGVHDVVVAAADASPLHGWSVALAHCARFDPPTRP